MKVSAPEQAAASAVDYFALLGQPRLPWLDPESLKAQFLKLAAQVHPDKAQDKAAANRDYAEINAAFRCLSEPRDRLRHLLELERGAPPNDVQGLPPGAMEMSMEIGRVCRETDAFLAERDKAESPLLKAQLFEAGMKHMDELNALRQQLDARREELAAELKGMNAALPLDRLEQIYRVYSFLTRWTGQVQERLAQLSF